jgi:hypothetical protein
MPFFEAPSATGRRRVLGIEESIAGEGSLPSITDRIRRCDVLRNSHGGCGFETNRTFAASVPFRLLVQLRVPKDMANVFLSQGSDRKRGVKDVAGMHPTPVNEIGAARTTRTNATFPN